MPVQPPSRDALKRIAAAYHMELTDEELETFAAAAGPALAGLTRLDELPDEQLPVRWPRADLGFADQSHLTRVLRAETGRTPAALRAALAVS